MWHLSNWGFFNHKYFYSGMQLSAHSEFLVCYISPLGETNFSLTNMNGQNWALWSVVTTEENAPNGIYQSKTAATFYFGHPPKKGRIKREKVEMNPVGVFWHLCSAFLVLSISNTNFNLNETFWLALEMFYSERWGEEFKSIKTFILKGWTSVLWKIPPRPLHWDIWKESSK